MSNNLRDERIDSERQGNLKHPPPPSVLDLSQPITRSLNITPFQAELACC